ncbi:MAG TPA: GNAT family N-acetyltransferase [Candidatus Limnocylindrales bacterium]|nr:GNAT family N-acetyltransferase [Candidatus Limnocylindrales bacterium]
MSGPLPDGLRLRPLEPSDGPAIAALFAASADTGAIRFRSEHRIDPYRALTYMGDDTGVVVERTETGAVVALGMWSQDEAVIRGELRPYALLHSLGVHPDVRRQGVASAIIAWRIAAVREWIGAAGFLIATIQKSNEGSFRAASRWATQVSPPMSSIAVKMRSRPPASIDGVRVRPARVDDLAEFGDRHAASRTDFDLWVPSDADRLAAWLERTPVATPIHELWLAEDRSGNLLAGVGVTVIGEISTLHVDAMPLPIRVVNTFVGIIPKSRQLERIALERAWFAPGAEAVGRHLFEAVRWELRGRGNVVIASFDPNGPLRAMIVAPRWLPRTAFSLAIKAELPLRPDHPFEGVQ